MIGWNLITVSTASLASFYNKDKNTLESTDSEMGIVRVLPFEKLNIFETQYTETTIDENGKIFFQESISEAEKELLLITKTHFQKSDFDTEMATSDILNWLNNYYQNIVDVVKKMENNIDQTEFSGTLLTLFELDSSITTQSRKNLALELLSSEKTKIRYAALSGLFYLAEQSDLNSIKKYYKQEKLLSLRDVYSDLILKLS